MGAKSQKYMSFSIGLFFLGLLGNLIVKDGESSKHLIDGLVVSGYMPQLALLVGFVILIIGFFIKEENRVAPRSQKYILFAIGVIFFGFLNCFMWKFLGVVKGVWVDIMMVYIPLIAIVVGLIFLIKGLVTKD